LEVARVLVNILVFSNHHVFDPLLYNAIGVIAILTHKSMNQLKEVMMFVVQSISN
jgi:hypothetical protein